MISVGESLRIGIRCVPVNKAGLWLYRWRHWYRTLRWFRCESPLLGSRLVRHLDRPMILTIGRTTQRRTYWRLVRVYAHGVGRVLPMRLCGRDDSVSVSCLLED